MPFFTSKAKRARKDSEQLVHLADKIWNYRHDLMNDAQRTRLQEARDTLHTLLRGKSATPETLKAATSSLDSILRETGGKFYPVGFFAENVEVFLVAAILAIGIRTFFIQPFKIPTNSMYPTYAGMTWEVFKTPEDLPSLPEKAVNRFLNFTSYHTITAPVSGTLHIPIQWVITQDLRYQSQMPFEMGKQFGILPQRNYGLKVGDTWVTVNVPAAFKLESILSETSLLSRKAVENAVFAHFKETGQRRGQLLINTEKVFEAGETILQFSINTGDMLFVDRFTYNFLPPEVGEPFVFRTEHVPGLQAEQETYYIKRLVGVGGDQLGVRDGVLLRNGEPITGAEAFELNAKRQGEYEGYLALSSEGFEKTGTAGKQANPIPARAYYAMGDNSDGSSDSREWGHVPEKAVVGKALFIFYPFTHRWGIAQ